MRKEKEEGELGGAGRFDELTVAGARLKMDAMQIHEFGARLF